LVQFGYEVSFFHTTDLYNMTQRMSSVGKGRCSPVHVNLEVSATAIVKTPYMTYANETYNAGSVDYVGSSGLYTTAAFIQEGLEDSATNKSKTYAADFWRDYKDNEQLLHLLRVSTLKDNSKYYPPAENACKDGSFGCLNACSKTAACTRREAQGKECMVVAMMYDYYDKAYVQAVFTNLDIPSYFCFLGYKAMEGYAIESAKNGTPVVFYHYEPDPLHAKYADVFERIALPRSTAERAMVATEKFGEYGYGNKTDNPVRVDFPLTSYSKYAATIVVAHEPLR
jgi:gamma-aminobutyric acid type B receptor